MSRKMLIWVLLLASLTFTTTFQQELIPRAPSRVTAVVRDCKSILVSWDAVSFNGTQLDTYTVKYEENLSNNSVKITVNGSQVQLRDLEPSTLYRISVAAVNGTASPEILNTTFGAMKATNLTVDNVTNHSAIFSWDIPPPNIGCNGNPIDTAFRVRYKSENGKLQKINNVRERSLVLPDLLPFTNYTVYVVTPDPSGSNTRSSDFVFTSLPGIPSAPINVQTVINNSQPTQLLITWQEPLTLNGIVSHYDVEFGEEGLSAQMVDATDTQLLLTGLNPSGVYVVRVRANNYAKLDLNEIDIIPGVFTNITTIRLPDPLPVPPGHPRDFRVTHKIFYGTKIELEFRWKPPSTGNTVDTYWIMCNKSLAGDNTVRPLSIRITLPTLHLTTKINANPFTAYHCHSYASNSVGDGPFSRTVSISPIPLASSPVRQLSVMHMNYSHVKLSWSRPNERNNFIASYLVILRDPSANTANNFTVSAPRTSIVVEALTGNTMYTFDVVAVTVFNGKLLNSNVTSTSVTTQTGTPSYPRDVVVEATSQATVQVQWSPPIPTNGIIIRYRVDFEVNAVYNTENGMREFSDSDSVTVQDLYYAMPLLTPGTHYTFNITAYTNEGPGPTVSVNNTIDNGRNDAITYFQLKLRPFMDCSKSQDTVTKQDIRNQLVDGLEEECACALDPSVIITDIQTQCNVEDSHLTYIGRIIGTKELRPLVLFNLLETWINKNSLVLQDEQLTIDQNCPLYLSSPRDRNCVPKVNPTTSPPPQTNPSPSMSSTIPSASPQPTGTAVGDLQDNSSDKTEIPILVGCFIGGVFLGCLITLCILVTVFCCHIRKRRKENIDEAIYARPSRKNKRIKVAANGNKKPVQMQTCPAYSVDSNGKESDYAIPRKRSGSIDSVDLQMYSTDSKIRGINNPIPYTPTHAPPCTPPVPPTYSPQPQGLYNYPTKQAMSLDNLSSYTNGRVAVGRNDSLYQSPRYPSLSVDDLLNGVPSRKFHYTFSPLHSATRSPAALPKTPKDTYDDPRTPSKVVPIGDNTYDAPKSYATRPLPDVGVGPSPKSVPRTPKDTYDDPRKPSLVTADNPTYDTPRPNHKELAGTPTQPLLMDDANSSPTSESRTPKDAYDDPRKPSGMPVNDTTYDSPRKPYDYTQLGTPNKPLLIDDKDDPDYSYVE